MSSTEKVTIYVRLEDFRPDAQQYKPYNPLLMPPEDAPIYVAIEVPEAWVIQHRGFTPPENAVILTPEGACEVLAALPLAMRKRLGGA